MVFFEVEGGFLTEAGVGSMWAVPVLDGIEESHAGRAWLRKPCCSRRWHFRVAKQLSQRGCCGRRASPGLRTHAAVFATEAEGKAGGLGGLPPPVAASPARVQDAEGAALLHRHVQGLQDAPRLEAALSGPPLHLPAPDTDDHRQVGGRPRPLGGAPPRL